jgi:Bacterial-like globin
MRSFRLGSRRVFRDLNGGPVVPFIETDDRTQLLHLNIDRSRRTARPVREYGFCSSSECIFRFRLLIPSIFTAGAIRLRREVFGGPDSYTRELGKHAALLRHHANLAITEAQRQRFVEVFLEAADEVGLPSVERFRRRFREYIEWGSRIALAISQPGADITTHEPVPRWTWE